MTSPPPFLEGARSGGSRAGTSGKEHPTSGGSRAPFISTVEGAGDVPVTPEDQEAPEHTGGLHLQPASQGVASLEELQATTDTGSSREHAATQSENTDVQHQNTAQTAPASDLRYRTRSATNSLPLATTHQPPLAAAPPTDPAQASATDPPVKRKPGRPRKHPLPLPPPPPPPNPAAKLGRPELTQLVAAARQGWEAKYRQPIQLSQRQPVPAAGPVPASADATTHTPSFAPPPPATYASHGFRPVPPPPLSPVGHGQFPPSTPGQMPAIAAAQVSTQTSDQSRLDPLLQWRPTIPAPAASHSPGQFPPPDPGQMAAPATAQVPTQTSGQLCPLPLPPPLRPIVPAPAAVQPYGQFPPTASGQMPMPASATAQVPPQTSDQFRLLPLPQLHPIVPAPAAIQPYGRFPPFASRQMPANASAPMPTQASFHFHPAAPIQLAPFLAASTVAHSLRAIAAFAAPQAQQHSFASSPPPPPPPPPPSARQPREPEDVYRDPQTDQGPALRHPADPVQRRPHEIGEANHQHNEERLVCELAAIYRAHNPSFSAFQPGYQHQYPAPNPPLLAISPSATLYPLSNDPAGDNMGSQPQYSPHGQAPFPFNAYRGHNLNYGPGLPIMTITGGPPMQCFQRSAAGNLADLGFGCGIEIADAFKGIAARYEREYRMMMVEDDRAMFGMGGWGRSA